MINLTSFSSELGLLGSQNFSLQLLAGVLADSSKYYRSFELPKRSGGTRPIDAPFPFLARVQKALAFYLEGRVHCSQQAFAYQKGRNAIMHARLHVGNAELLTVDIQNFFGSISRQQIHQTLLQYGFEESFSYITSLVSTLNGTLPQGGCTSPVLSNLVFYSLDFRLSRLASHLGITYSRYADDLAFSGDHIPRNLPVMIEKIISAKGFSLNPRKTRLKIRGAKKIITGVSISSGVLKAPRKFVRALRAEIHKLECYKNKLSTLDSVDPLKYERVLGKLNYWLQIEPDNIYASEKKRSLSTTHQEFLGLSADFKFEDYTQIAA
jgi:hypothetical protein